MKYFTQVSWTPICSVFPPRTDVLKNTTHNISPLQASRIKSDILSQYILFICWSTKTGVADIRNCQIALAKRNHAGKTCWFQAFAATSCSCAPHYRTSNATEVFVGLLGQRRLGMGWLFARSRGWSSICSDSAFSFLRATYLAFRCGTYMSEPYSILASVHI